ncbi:MAG: hypothetical protein JRD93_08520 [Deltaproteobacteria bacterium]|nr:hypothetical protein [Deltaproteobacteria bacterium]
MYKHKRRRDRFYRSRGGTCQILEISCGACRAFRACYQKDGQGRLFRLYVDRLQIEGMPRCRFLMKGDMPLLKCEKCGLIMGIPMIYKPEDRLAWRLVPGAWIAKRIK